MTAQPSGAEKPDLPATGPVLPGDSDEFLVIIATGFEPNFAGLFADIVRFAFPDAKLKIVIADSRSIPDLANLPEFPAAALVLVLMSNLQGDARPEKKGQFLDWGTWMEKRVRLMRARTNAHLICMSGLDRLDAFKGMERGGAHTVIQMPVRSADLQPVILDVYSHWLTAHTEDGRGRVFRVLIGAGRELQLCDMFSEVIRAVLPDARLDIQITESMDVHEIALLPEARSADFLLFHLGNLLARIPDDESNNGSPEWHGRRVRILRNTWRGGMVCMTGRFKETTGEAMRAAGADLGLPAPCNLAEIRTLLLDTHKRWLARTETASPPAPRRSVSSSSFESRRTRNILVGDDPFADILAAVLEDRLAGICEFKFIRFRTEKELRELAATGNADLIFLYIGNVSWNADHADRRKGISFEALKDRLRRAIDILGEISRAYQVPVIAIQGTDLQAEADRARVTLLEAPFTIADLMPAVYSALGIRPPHLSLSGCS
jgi:hypothetical protein